MRIFKRTRTSEGVADPGHGPIERLDTANAIITASGHLMACTR